MQSSTNPEYSIRTNHNEGMHRVVELSSVESRFTPAVTCPPHGEVCCPEWTISTTIPAAAPEASSLRGFRDVLCVSYRCFNVKISIRVHVQNRVSFVHAQRTLFSRSLCVFDLPSSQVASSTVDRQTDMLTHIGSFVVFGRRFELFRGQETGFASGISNDNPSLFGGLDI
jgi:hypothetical protein